MDFLGGCFGFGLASFRLTLHISEAKAGVVGNAISTALPVGRGAQGRSSSNFRRQATMMVTIWRGRATVPPQRGMAETGDELERRALGDWTWSKSWEEVTPGALSCFMHGRCRSSASILECRHRRARLAGLRDKELDNWKQGRSALLFFERSPFRPTWTHCRRS